MFFDVFWEVKNNTTCFFRGLKKWWVSFICHLWCWYPGTFWTSRNPARLTACFLCFCSAPCSFKYVLFHRIWLIQWLTFRLLGVADIPFNGCIREPLKGSNQNPHLLGFSGHLHLPRCGRKYRLNASHVASCTGAAVGSHPKNSEKLEVLLYLLKIGSYETEP